VIVLQAREGYSFPAIPATCQLDFLYQCWRLPSWWSGFS